jgi:putative two-component system response regulator
MSILAPDEDGREVRFAVHMHSDEGARELHAAAVLHDIDKIGIPGRILNKPGELSPDEFPVMAEHTIIG